MSLKKDKQKVLGEIFDDARIKTFLEYEAPEGVSRDFHLLEKAYRGMKVENFATFLSFFKEAGYDLKATNPAGHNIADIMQQHNLGADYVVAYNAAV